MPKRNLLQYIFLGLKGMMMGAADVVPGVSGGTIAFISGIYEELISSINKINLGALKVWKSEGFLSFWKHINGTFFLVLFAGIAVSFLSLAKLVTSLLKSHPILIWSFFFGLIIASVWLISKTIKKWSPSVIIALLIGVGVGFYITTIKTVGAVDGQWYIVLSGAIAICAMILPGVSGAFILLLLGSYDKVLTAISDKDLVIIALFGAGCILGLLSFARVLKYLFTKFNGITIAILAGFMIGSLNKVWPWKETESFRINTHGESVPFIQNNVVPNDFIGDPKILGAVLCMVVGFLLIFTLERFAPKEA